MRLQAGPFPRTLDNRVRHAQPVAQPPRRPMGRAVRRPAQDPRFHLRRQRASLRPAMATAQSGEAIRFIPCFPGRDRLRRAVNALANRRSSRVSVGEEQNDPGPSGFVSTPTVRTRERLELGSGRTRQRQRSASSACRMGAFAAERWQPINTYVSYCCTYCARVIFRRSYTRTELDPLRGRSLTRRVGTSAERKGHHVH